MLCMVRPVTKNLPALLGFLIAIGPVSTDMYLPAFPAIAHDLGSVAAPQYSLAAYFTGLAIGQMTVGALSDRLGRRTPLLVGLLIYTLGTIGCLMSWDMHSLVVFRFISALGAAAGTILPRAMVRDLADGPQAAKLLSKLMLVMGVAPITAPMLGAFVVAFFSWRMIFGFCALYGVAALVLTWLYLPDTLPIARRTRLGMGAVLVRYAGILSERAFLTHAGVGAFTAATLFAYLAGTPQIFITIYGWHATGYALLFGFNSMAYIGFSQINPGLVTRFGIAPIISFASVAMLIPCLALAILALHPRGAMAIAGGLLLCEGGFGLLTPNALVGAMSRHQAHAGSASALFGTLQYSGGALAGLLVGVLADGSAKPMAFVMLACAGAALLSARARPHLVFAPAE
jgi:DHA1 family bicyclomycin/chloramphenicol resistance-like MFS transporter